MKYLISLVLLISSTHILFGQQFVIDSLSQLLKTEKNPIQKADLHLGLSRAYSFVNSQSEQIKINNESALKLSKKHGYREGEAIAIILEATRKSNQKGNPIVTYESTLKAIDIAQSIPSKSLETFAQYKLAEYYIYDKNDDITGINILNKTIQQIDETVADIHIGNCYKVLGLAYETQGRDSLAIQAFEKAISYFNRVKTHPFTNSRLGRPSAMEADMGIMNKAHVHLYMGRVYEMIGIQDKSIDYLTTAKNVFETGEAHIMTALTLEELGIAYLRFGMGEKSIEAYQGAAKIFEAIDSEIDLAWISQRLGDAFINLKEYANAKTYLSKSLVIAKRRADTVLLMDLYDGLGEVNRAQGKLEQALAHIKEKEIISMAFNDSTSFALNHINFGRIYFEQNKHKASLNQVRQALKWSKYFNSLSNQYDSYRLLGMNYMAISQFDSARCFLQIADTISQQTGRMSARIALQKNFSELYEKQGDYKNALAVYKNYFKLFNEFYTEKGQQKLKEEQVRQDVVAMQKEKDLAEKEASFLAQRNQLYLTLAIALLGILLVVSYLFNQLRKTKKQIEVQNLQLHQLNATKDKFFGIIAHDIRSPIIALNGVGKQMDYYLKKNKPEKLERLAKRIDTTSKRLSALLDNLLKWALLQQGVIPYRPKALNIKTIGEQIFQMFQNNAAAKEITLDLQVEDHFHVHADEAALNTILRNLVSNAIKFTPEGGKVSLSTESNDDKVFININDTGIGISAGQLANLFSLEKNIEKGTAGEKGTGLGLTLVKELTELNKGTIKVISELQRGTQFMLGLPAISTL